MEKVFRALASPSRRALLDRLADSDGLTLGELCEVLPELTRFGVSKHLGVLESAQLVVTERDGRRKLHYLNPVPIRRIHDRWISKYAEPFTQAMVGLADALDPDEEVDHAQAKHRYETFIRATPAEVWAAITRPEFTRRYFHGTSFESELRSGGRHRYVLADGREAVEGTIEEIELERRLVMTWHVLYDAEMAEEPPSRVEWSLAPANDDGTVTRLTVRHLDLGMSPRTSTDVALGWVMILDSMKSLLETGSPLGELTATGDRPEVEDDERRHAAAANGAAWELLGKVGPDGAGLESGEIDELLERAGAAAYHWRLAAEPDAPQQARAAWMLSRCHVVAGNVDAALRYAQRCAESTAAAPEAADFDRAYAHEAMARALALAGRSDEAARHRRAAAEVEIADPEDRAIVESDLAAGPWFGLTVDV